MLTLYTAHVNKHFSVLLCILGCMKTDASIQTIDQYIARYPRDVQDKLEQIRTLVHEIVPEAKEKISYGLATFTFHGNLVHFGAYDAHIGFYPGATPIAQFAPQLTAYATSKGTVRFPLDEPLPLDVIGDMVRAAAARNLTKKKG